MAIATPVHAMTVERAKFRKSLRRFDLVLFGACALIGFDTVSAIAANGGQAIVWLLVLLVFFAFPYGMLVAELGSTFPVEGGPYAWARMAFGRLPGSITATLYWLSNPVWLGGTTTVAVVATLNAFFFHKPLGTAAEIIIGLVVTWVTIGVAIVAMRWGKWGPNLGAIAKTLTTIVFVALVIAFLVDKGRPAGTVHVADLKPSIYGFLGVVGLLMFAVSGFETSSGASEEMHDPQRDVPRMVLRSGLMMAIIYAAVVVGILLVIPKSTLSSVTGFVAAYRHVATTLGGSAHAFGYFFAILILLSIISSTAVWLEGADRTQAVAALDGNAPTWVGKFSSVGTPIAVNLMSGIIASAFVFFVFILAKGSLSSFFAVMLSLVISTTALSYLFMFPALVVLRKKYPDHPRPYKVPGGTVGAWVAVVLTELFVVITAITLLWPGLLNNMLGQSYSIESSWGVSRAYFEEVTLGSLAVMILLAIVFWWFGSRALAKGTVGENDLLELPGSTADLEGGSDG